MWESNLAGVVGQRGASLQRPGSKRWWIYPLPQTNFFLRWKSCLEELQLLRGNSAPRPAMERGW
jgi:hypothetical protein